VTGGLWNVDYKPDLWTLAQHYRRADSLNQSVEWIAELIYGQPLPDAIAAALDAAAGKDEKEKLPLALAALLARPEAQLA
jgi:hypothetical protein